MPNLAGTYFTSWEYTFGSYQIRPIIVIGDDNSVVVDGLTMNGVIVYDTYVSWSSSSSNPSSGCLQFTFSSTFNAMTFVGSYSMGDESLSSYLFGFATQPAEALSAWNDMRRPGR